MDLNMDLNEAMKTRHSVRSYKNVPLKPEHADALLAEIEACNQKSGLHIQLIKNEPKAFDSFFDRSG